MRKCNYTVDTLINKLDYLKHLCKTCENEKLLDKLGYDIYFLETIIEEFNVVDYDNLTPSHLEKIKNIQERINQVRFLWPDFREFFISTNYISPYEEIELKRSSLSSEDILTLTHDFYKSLNSFFYGNFMKNFRHRFDHLRFTSDDDYFSSGYTFFISSLKEAYITVNRIFTLDDYCTTVHEYAHATSFQIYSSEEMSKSIFEEIISIFMELISMDYYYNLTKDKNAISLKAKYFDNFINTAELANFAMTLSLYDNLKFKNNYELKAYLRQNMYEDTSLVDPTYEEDFETYLTSFLFAIELYNIYEKDKEKALDILKKFIYTRNLSSEKYYDNLKKLGLIPNLSINTIQNKFAKQYERIIKK